MSSQIILSGIQPTANLTIGNYLGAIKNWLKLQADYRCFFMAVDQHAITVRQDPEKLRSNTKFALATYIAAGVDPEASAVFVQSQVPEHSQLTWILNNFGYMGELSRMTQFKDKSQRAGNNIPAGLFTYPLLMAADILLYNTNLVPVGEDQKQHIELTRNLAERMNNLFGDDTFTVPEPFIAGPGARVMDLQNPTNKMSKSAENEKGSIFLSDSPKTILKKFKGAVTDSGSEVTYESGKPGIKNLIDIQSAFTNESPDDIVKKYQGKGYGHLKIETAEAVIAEVEPLQTKTEEILNDPAELERILINGADRAREVANTTLKRVYDRVGFLQF